MKYTSNGRKYFIKDLNDVEVIAREVMIVNGQEIPHPKSIVISKKNLYDTKPITLLEKEMAEVINKYNNTLKEYQAYTNQLQKEIETVLPALKNKLESIKELNSTLNIAEFQTLIDFLSGEIKYVITIGNSIEVHNPADAWELFEYYNQGAKFQGFKLLSIVGDSDGKLSFGLSNSLQTQYGFSLQIILCKNMEDVIDKLTGIMISKTAYTTKDIMLMAEYNIKANPVILQRYEKDRILALENTIKSYKNRIELTENEQTSLLEAITKIS